jgi:predicted ATPase
MLTLKKFKVTNFRSIMDSGWIDCNDVTTLVGINESGKSNVILALWKLNPARDEGEAEIDLRRDMPNSKYSEWRHQPGKYYFIHAHFEMNENIAQTLIKTGCSVEDIAGGLIVRRTFDGKYYIKSIDRNGNECIRKEEGFYDAARAELPSFVYYSNYGNLDAQIYLPHAVELLNGNDVPGYNNLEKVRTMRVLFEFVGLDANEVLELGKQDNSSSSSYSRNAHNQQTQVEIENTADKKAERATLLNSASAKLTSDFKIWWKQGTYKFRLQADGDYFKIWVSDDKREDEIELEQRSTGLQWFLSFFLTFLVESQDAHKGAILLLDEAGLTLHPKAQEDLMEFFNGLSEDNQIVHTTHSPFLLNTSHIDRVKVVFSDAEGYTVVSSDLRASIDRQNEKSIYPAHAALGLSVSDILLNGCQAVIVEGTSDQYYLNAIKLHLINKGKIKPKKELLFIPAGGCTSKAVKAIASIVSGKNEELPYIIFDSDTIGESAQKSLLANMYKDDATRIISAKDITGVASSEVEDFIPFYLMQNQINKWFGSLDDDFTPNNSKPIIPQIKSFAENSNVELPEGWKVILAKGVKRELEKTKIQIAEDTAKKWKLLFDKIK